jgi:hypothetical protein
MWRKLFSLKEITTPDISIIRVVNTLVERLTSRIFEDYARDLVKSDTSYIIYAAWGAKESGHLTETQKSIHNKIDPEVRAIYDSLKLGNLGNAQSMAIYSLIRGFVIFKILFMVEHLRNNLSHAKSADHETVREVLQHIRAIGND